MAPTAKKVKLDPNEGLKFTLFTTQPPINQKNFYTEYLKNDNQYFGQRQFLESVKKEAAVKKAKKEAEIEAKNNANANDDEDDDEDDTPEATAALGSKVIVLHLGSSRTRLGLASDPHPKTVPTVVARPTEIRASPKLLSQKEPGKGMFGDDFEAGMKLLDADFRARMRNAKRRVLPNATELVATYNKRSEYEEVADHNDPGRFEWTDVTEKPRFITGEAALRIDPQSDPPYTLNWPIRHGMLNEDSYTSREAISSDLSTIIVEAIISELNVKRKSFPDYSVAFMVPDMYDKAFVEIVTSILFREHSFGNVAIIQESVAATFGAGLSSATVVDVGAQKTSIACVEEGLCLADSRLLLRYGGDDLTLLFAKQLLRMSFPYRDFDLSRAYDWTLAEELKLKFCSSSEAEAAVQLYHIFQRQPKRQARKYNFKVHDDQITCTMAYFHPEIFENDNKYRSRHTLLPKSMDLYEDIVQEPDSVIQDRLLYGKASREPNNIHNISGKPIGGVAAVQLRPTAAESSSAPVVQDTPMLDSPQVQAQDRQDAISTIGPDEPAEDDHEEIPLIAPLDVAIISAITCACENAINAEERLNTMVSTILITGAGYNFPYANYYLEERIRALRPGWSNVTIVPPPRDMQPEMLCWKGMSIFSRIKIAGEMWVSAREYDLLGSRALQQKSLGYFWMG